MEKKPRVIRPVEERIADIDKAIAKHEANIAALKEKKSKILSPAKRRGGKVGMATVIKKAKELGISPEDLLQKLEQFGK